MYGGNSGCNGMVIYNKKENIDKAVYGYYVGNEMRFETGTREAMGEFRSAQEKSQEVKAGGTGKRMAVLFIVYLALVITSFVVLPLKVSFALLLFCVISYVPLLIILAAGDNLYENPEDNQSFCRFHGCEHAIISRLTHDKECSAAALEATRYYDTECGTAYSGYAVLMAVELAILVIFWPGLLKAIAVILATITLIVVMILKPVINPFTLLQHKVVAKPTMRECVLGEEIVKRLKEM